MAGRQPIGSRQRRQPRRRDAAILTREDIGYGPPRPYEYTYGPAMTEPRERRLPRRERRAEPPPPGLGPYHERLRRRRRPDHWIRADVEEALFADTWVNSDRISVEIENGVAILTGMLPTQSEVRRALDDAAGVRGVRDVRNRLEVEP